LAGLQRIALRIDQKEPGGFPAYLPAEDQVDVELEAVALERRAVHVRDAPDLFADDARGVVERRRLGEALALIEVPLQQRDHGLRAREAAAAEQDEDALAVLDEEMHLARNVDLIVAGVGTRVGGHHETLAHPDADAICHAGHGSRGTRNARL